MKQFLLKALCAASLFLSVKTINAQCSLDQVGAPNYSTTCSLSDMAVSPTSNVLYTISFNTGAGNKFFLHSATVASSWTPVASLSGTTSVKPVININKSGKVYVAIKDDAAGQVGKLYYESAGSFIQVGTAFSGSNKVSDLSIAFNSLGEEYVAYTDITNGNLATVKKWNGSTWVAVGSGTVSTGTAYYNSLIIDKTDSPVLAFEDMSAGNKATVMKFNGTTWNAMTSLGTNPTNTKLKLGQNGDYYLGYTESTGSVVVQKFNGSVWAALGSPITAMSFSANTFDLDLDPNDLPYFICQNNTSLYAAAFKYTGVPTWSNVIGANLTSVTSNNLNIGIDKTGSPYFFYVDQPGNNGLNVKTITSPISISSQPLSVSRCNNQSGSFSVGTVGGVPTGYQWQTLGAGTFTNSSAPYNNGTTSALTFVATTSMNQNQVRCVVNVGCKNIITNTPTLTVVTPSSNLVSTNPTCFGACNGMITSTPSGGTGPYSFTWSPGGASTQNLSGACAGTYSLTTADISGCTVTATGIVTNPSPISTSFSGNMTICNGSNTSLTITATGGTPSYSFSWTPGATLSSTNTAVTIANPTSTQTYTVTAMDAMGCTATNTVMITVNALPAVSASNSNICSGGIATLNASGSAHTYTWNPGNMVGAIQNVSPGTTTTYTVVGTNTLTSCTNSATAMVTVYSLPTVNAGPSRTLTCVNTSTTLAGSTTGGITYSWTGPGIVSGSTTLNPTINAAGTYDLTVTSAQGCSAGPSPVTVSQDTTPPSPTATTSGTLTCSTTTVSVIGTGGGTYSWSGPGIVAGGTTSNATVNSPGIYNLTVMAANGCTNIASTTVTQNTVAPSPTASNSGTLTCSTATVALTGGPAAGVTYLWSGPGISGSTTTQNTSANAPGIYTLTVVSAANGCSASATTAVTQNVTPPSVTATNSTTLTCITASGSLSGTGGGTYIWSGPGIVSGSTTANPIVNQPGCYNLTVTAANGCTATATTCVTQNTIAPATNTNVSGTLNCTLTSVNASASTTTTPVSYNWSGAGITSATNISTITVNAGGIKNYTVTNASNGCVTTGSLNVSQNLLAPSSTASSTGTITCVTSTVQLACTPAAGVTYTWTAPSGSSILSGANSQNAIGAGAGTYSIFVQSTSSGCTNGATVAVNQNTVTPTVALTTTSISCNSACNGAITSTVSGGVSPYTYLWTPGGATTSSISALCAGVYTLATTGANGCIITATAIITQPSAMNGNIVTNSVTCFNACNGSITSSPIGGIAPYSYTLTTPTGTLIGNSATNQCAGNYTFTIKDANNCVITPTFNLLQPSSIVPSFSGNQTICSSNSTTLTLNVTGGTPGYTMSWTPGSTLSSTNTAVVVATPTTNQTYSASITDANGCNVLSTITVTVNSTPTITITGNMNICSGSTTSLTANGATSYTWSSGENTNTISITPTVTTSYTVDADNGNGCSNSLPVTVSIIPNKSITGVITSTAGATGGDIIIYKYTATLSHWDSLTITPIGGTYSFNNIDSGLYVLRAIPTATNVQVTYAPNAISWQGATIINHGCTNNTSQNIDLIGFAPYVVGPGILTGQIVEAFGYVPKASNDSKPLVPGTPIGGIIVKGGKNPGGQMLVQTITATDGTYTLTGLPINTLPDEYFIFVDIPGLDTNGTYHLSIASGTTTITGLDFNVDAQYINPIGSVTAILNDNSVLENKVVLFPNPASQTFTLEYELIQAANVQIELYDIIGHKVKTITRNSFEEKNKYSYSVNIEDLSTGVYFVKLYINGSNTTMKIIINQ